MPVGDISKQERLRKCCETTRNYSSKLNGLQSSSKTAGRSVNPTSCLNTDQHARPVGLRPIRVTEHVIQDEYVKILRMIPLHQQKTFPLKGLSNILCRSSITKTSNEL